MQKVIIKGFPVIHKPEKGYIMTQKEYKRCTGLMIDAISHANRSNECYEEIRVNKALTDIQIQVKELQGQNALGYAEGINQVLVVLGFKHEKMKELQKLL